jgi:hypothetical protein
LSTLKGKEIDSLQLVRDLGEKVVCVQDEAHFFHSSDPKDEEKESGKRDNILDWL